MEQEQLSIKVTFVNRGLRVNHINCDIGKQSADIIKLLEKVSSYFQEIIYDKTLANELKQQYSSFIYRI
ncbi:hypothetical protein [Candidatus Tisiphia endosymbiont of Nedyus quadrimaculatus]|uniref:hypothetical protein n=1 Tax=Candidatus Tisiphia endosymbiont of Nedyus quadrimaculatus TaxID=3139332 RepID=UPI00345F131F